MEVQTPHHLQGVLRADAGGRSHPLFQADRRFRTSDRRRKAACGSVWQGRRSYRFLNATESTGLQLGLDSYRAPWKIICIRTAFKEYKTYGADLYKEALTMLARGWEGDPDSLRSGILQGMMRFVALYQGEYDPERLVKRLHTVHPMTLVRDEKSLSGTVRYKYMMLILRTYNGASRRRNLPIKP